jgi:hypothetical protein
MAAFPSVSLPPDVAARLIAEFDSAYDELTALIGSLPDRGFTQAPPAKSIELARIVRRIAVVSTALHGRGFRALTNVERIWLAAQGVPIDRRVVGIFAPPHAPGRAS